MGFEHHPRQRYLKLLNWKPCASQSKACKNHTHIQPCVGLPSTIQGKVCRSLSLHISSFLVSCSLERFFGTSVPSFRFSSSDDGVSPSIKVLFLNSREISSSPFPQLVLFMALWFEVEPSLVLSLPVQAQFLAQLQLKPTVQSNKVSAEHVYHHYIKIIKSFIEARPVKRKLVHIILDRESHSLRLAQ